MARLVSREFHPAVTVVVRRFFVAAGRHWNPGDVFDWPRLSVAQRRVKQLFDAGKLMHPEDGSIEMKPAAPAPAPAETPRLATEDADILAAAATPAEQVEPEDDLTDLDMKQLRAIAEEIGAPSRVSRAAQRQAIRETRAAAAAAR